MTKKPCAEASSIKRVELGAYSGIVDRRDHTSAIGQCSLDEPLVEVQRVLADIDEDRDGAAEHDGVRQGRERKRGDDHLVARPDVRKERRHLERACARVGQQDAA